VQVAAVTVLGAFALMFPRGAVAALCSAARATGLGLWLATFMAGMVTQTELHETAHALVFRLTPPATSAGSSPAPPEASAPPSSSTPLPTAAGTRRWSFLSLIDWPML
jgi:hypothetical protein